MSQEIEAKIKVPELKAISTRLNALDAEPLREISQADIYFLDAEGVLIEKGCGLRIRQQVIGGQSEAMITFKGPKSDSKFKSRAEYETGIGDVETMRRIFESLGYHERLTVKKNRTMYLLDGCEVCLDQLALLGSFVEVEGPDEETITGVLTKLGLDNEPHISDSYASMVSAKMKQEQPNA